MTTSAVAIDAARGDAASICPSASVGRVIRAGKVATDAASIELGFPYSGSEPDG